MASDFVKRLDTDQGELIFIFTSIHIVNGTIYFITAMGRASEHFFRMENRNGSWKIVQAPQPPGWIMEQEEWLAKIIEEVQGS